MISAVDLFCGAGGTSSGLVRAARAKGRRLQLLAVNHWATAVDTHARNHPWARHVCADLAAVEADPSRLVPDGRLDILVASPECTHHSVARGGKPRSNQSRASAWHVLHWAERLEIGEILIENVVEFQSWGPLGRDGRPDKTRKGETFHAFAGALESLGYVVESRILNAADFGDATTRRRLFLRASRDGAITWPVPTHSGRWREAGEVIDWSLPSPSIFSRKRKLARRTIMRIEAGLREFGGEPFIAMLCGYENGASGYVQRKMAPPAMSKVNEPLRTISACGTHHALCEPFIIPMEHRGSARLRSVSEPLPTITTAKGGAFGLCEPKPFLTKFYGNGRGACSVEEPLATITTKDRFALVLPQGNDIGFRMLRPHELAAAMGFEDYHFAGTKTEQVKQIGNAVPVNVAAALCGEMIRG